MIKKKTVFILDDEKDTRDSLRMMLEMEGYRAFTAANVDECLKMLRIEKPDLIIMDIMMPGTAVCKILDHTPIITIYHTGIEMDKLKEDGLLDHKHVVDVIRKPSDIDDIIAKIKKHIG